MNRTWNCTLLLVILLTGCASNQARVSDTQTRHADTLVQLGLGYMQKGDLNVALEKLSMALEAADNYAPSHNAIAILYTRLERYDEADKHYRRSVKLAPDDGNLSNNYGAFLCGRKQYSEAYEQFYKAAKQPLYGTPELAYENAGLCALRENNLEMAETSFRNALKIRADMTVSLINMARVALLKSNYLQGRAYIQRFEEKASHSPATLQLAIEVERGLGATQQVEKYSEMLRSRFPDSEQAANLDN